VGVQKLSEGGGVADIAHYDTLHFKSNTFTLIKTITKIKNIPFQNFFKKGLF
jgi:hypothetical protein